MEIHIRLTLDAPRGWARRLLTHVAVPVALVGVASTAVWAYDTEWIASGQPISASALKDDLDEIQARLVELESQRVLRANIGANGQIDIQTGDWIAVVDSDGPGHFEITFEDDIFTSTPTCVATPNLGNLVAPTVECYNAFSTGIVCAAATDGMGVETGLFLVCVGD